jgi:hypothetical protein
LAYGHAAERRAAEVLSAAGCPARRLDGRLNDLAVRVGDREAVAEVKGDRMAAVTGNVAVEFWNTRADRPSGLSATRAHLWLVVIDGAVWAASVNSVRRTFSAGGQHVRDVLAAGDGNAAVRLFPARAVLGPCFVRLDTLTAAAAEAAVAAMLADADGPAVEPPARPDID